MDERKNIHEVKPERNNGETSDILIRHGNWVVRVSKLGLCVENTVIPERYHFMRESNGWITGENRKGLTAMNSTGKVMGVGQKYNEKEVQLHNFDPRAITN